MMMQVKGLCSNDALISIGKNSTIKVAKEIPMEALRS